MYIFRNAIQQFKIELFSQTLLTLSLIVGLSQSVSAKIISEPYQLNSDLQVFGDVVSARFSPDGQYLVYASDQEVNQQFEIFSVRVTGGEVTRLNTQLTLPGSDVGFFEISPDGQWVVYRADSEQDNMFEIFSVPIAGGTPVRLNVNLPNGGDIRSYKISPDSSRVVYIADQIVSERVELFSVPISGGSVQRLNSQLPTDGDVEQFSIDSNSGRVVYTADRNNTGDRGLYSTSIASGGATPLTTSNDVLDFKIRPDGEFVVFRAINSSDEIQLYRVATLGSFVLRLNATLPDGGSVGRFEISADNSRVVYLADQNIDDVTELFSVTFAASLRTRLNGDLAIAGEEFVGDVAGYQLSPDGQSVLYYADQIQDGVFELFRVGVTGGPNTRLNTELPIGGDVIESGFKFTPDSTRVVYLADQTADNVTEIFSVPVLGGTPTRLNADLPVGGDVIFDFQIAPDSSYITYHAQQNTADVNELYLVPTDGGNSKRINGNLPIGADVEFFYQISSDGQHVIYRADQDVFDQIELFAVSVEDQEQETCFPIKARSGGVVVFCL